MFPGASTYRKSSSDGWFENVFKGFARAGAISPTIEPEEIGQSRPSAQCVFITLHTSYVRDRPIRERCRRNICRPAVPFLTVREPPGSRGAPSVALSVLTCSSVKWTPNSGVGSGIHYLLLSNPQKQACPFPGFGFRNLLGASS